MVRNAINPSLQPRIGIRLSFRLLVVMAEKSVVALVVALHGRRVRPVPALDHSVDQKSGNHSAIGIARDYVSINNFFGYHDNSLRRPNRFDHHSEIAPTMRVAFTISALQMNDGYIRRQRPHCMKLHRVTWGQPPSLV